MRKGKPRALVTGGAGFIGSHVAGAIVEQGFDTVVIDDLSSGLRQNVPQGATFCEMDIRSTAAADLIRDLEPEILFHHAAQMDVRRSVADPLFDADVNVNGLLHLLGAGMGSGLRKVVFASTGGAIYGEQRAYPADEDHPCWPLSPYGVAKLACEKYLYYFHKEHGLDATCLRYANIYGPRQNAHGEAGVVAIFVSRLLEGRTATIFGDGQSTRDYTYVDDVVRANIACIDQTGFHLFNVGTGVETSVNVLFEKIRDLTGSRARPEYAEARPGEQRRSSISSKKIRAQLGVDISIPIEQGLVETVKWYRDRPK